MPQKRPRRRRDYGSRASKKAKLDHQSDEIKLLSNYHHFIGWNDDHTKTEISRFDKTSVADPEVLLSHVRVWSAAAWQNNDPKYVSIPLRYLISNGDVELDSSGKYINTALKKLVKEKKQGLWEYIDYTPALWSLTADISLGTSY